MQTQKNEADPVTRPNASVSVPGSMRDRSSQTSPLPAILLGLVSSLCPAIIASIGVRHEYDLIQQDQMLLTFAGGIQANGDIFGIWFHWAVMAAELSLLSSLWLIITVLVCGTPLCPTPRRKASYAIVAIGASVIFTALFLLCW